MKILDNGSAYERDKSKDRRNSYQFLMIRPNHERNRDSVKGENLDDV